MATNATVTVVKLNNENYQLWKFKVEMLLIKEDLWTVITGEAPTPLTNAWTKKDNQARATICLLIEDNQIENIRTEKTAKEIWDKLKSIHERDNLTSKLYLLRKLYSMKYQEGTPMQDHITKILEIVSKLRAVKEEIKDTHIGALLLCSLPNSYESLITALEAWPEKELNLELIKNKVLDEANRRSERKQNQNSDEAIAFKTYRNGNKYCTICRKNNHETSECRYKMRNEKNFEKYPYYRSQMEPPSRKNFSARTISKEHDDDSCFDYVTPRRKERERETAEDSEEEGELYRVTTKPRRRQQEHEENFNPSFFAFSVREDKHQTGKADKHRSYANKRLQLDNRKQLNSVKQPRFQNKSSKAEFLMNVHINKEKEENNQASKCQGKKNSRSWHTKRTKLDYNAEKEVNISYAITTKGLRIFVPVDEKVRFDEVQLHHENPSTNILDENSIPLNFEDPSTNILDENSIPLSFQTADEPVLRISKLVFSEEKMLPYGNCTEKARPCVLKPGVYFNKQFSFEKKQHEKSVSHSKISEHPISAFAI